MLIDYYGEYIRLFEKSWQDLDEINKEKIDE